ncbi:MAG: alanine racemase [Bacteroidia bacterium]
MYASWLQALRGVSLPAAFVDMNALEENIQSLLARVDKPVRLATKSLRCVSVMHHIWAWAPTRWAGWMCYTPREAWHLSQAGFDNFLIGYPTTQVDELHALTALLQAGRKVIAMVDSVEAVEALEMVLAGTRMRIGVCLDVDASSDWGILYFGVRRSPINSVEGAVLLAQRILRAKNLFLAGVMLYEAQIAGVGDKGSLGGLVRWLKRRSFEQVKRRRAEVVSALRGLADLELVNGGGSGSWHYTLSDPSITEITVGSAFYAPGLFDAYVDAWWKPAAGFALPIVRRPTKQIFTCAGGGYIASGAAGKDKLPQVWLPQGGRLLRHEGAGEVQTPVWYAQPPSVLAIGKPIFFRHSKAGELAEAFPFFHLLRGDSLEKTVPTYRGQGMKFL